MYPIRLIISAKCDRLSALFLPLSLVYMCMCIWIGNQTQILRVQTNLVYGIEQTQLLTREVPLMLLICFFKCIFKAPLGT